MRLTLPARLRGTGLVALTTGSAAAGFAVLRVTGLGAAGPLAPPVSAPGALGPLHDVRWLEVFTRSPASFGLEPAAILAVRTLLTAAAVRLAWPPGPGRPGRRQLLGTAFAFTVVSTIFVTPSATLLFDMAVTPLTWWFLTALVCGVAPTLLLAQAAVPGSCRRQPPARALAWTAPSGVALTMAALAIDATRGWIAVVPVIAAGVWNACAWRGIVAAAVRRPVGLRAPALGVATAVAAAAGVDGAAAAEPVSVRAPIVVVDGFRGLDARGRPLPYPPAATHGSLTSVAGRLARETAVLHRRTGRAVTVIATSEGAMVTKLYLLEHLHAPVAAVLLLSPIIDASHSSGVAAGGVPRAEIPVAVEPVVHGAVEDAGATLGGGSVHPFAVVRHADRLQRTGAGGWRLALTLVRRSAPAWRVPPMPDSLWPHGRSLPCR